MRDIRKLVQVGFLALILWIGVVFFLFVRYLENPLALHISRPPGVEGFLPISSLMSLKHFLLTGVFNTIHPAGLVLFTLILIISLVFKKAFCGWICPFAFLSEYISKLHDITLKKLRMPVWLDWPLRGIKYLLLGFFLWAILFKMNVHQIEKFIYSSYNRVADIKMLLFFTNISGTSLIVIALLVVLSFLFKKFWCQYLCPYGGLLGGLSMLSPFKIRRDVAQCVVCKKCTKACPNLISVHTKNTVFSDECYGCYECVGACTKQKALRFSLVKGKLPLSKISYAVVIVIIFFGGIGVAKLTGFWQNEITAEEYRTHIPHIDEPGYKHNRGVPKQEQ
jgi:polyferredoxin